MTDYQKPQFPMGKPAITPAAETMLNALGIHPIRLLARHTHGDWGDVCIEDQEANDQALLTGRRLLSSYNLPNNRKVWVITEADRSVTTILLPEDY